MLLRMLFWFAARLRTLYNSNGRITCMLNSPNGGNFQKFTAHLTNGTTKRKGKTSTIFKNPKAQVSTLRPCLSLQKTLVDNQDTVTPLQAKFYPSIRPTTQLEALQLSIPLTLRKTINRLLKYRTRINDRTKGVFFALRTTNYLYCRSSALMQRILVPRGCRLTRIDSAYLRCTPQRVQTLSSKVIRNGVCKWRQRPTIGTLAVWTHCTRRRTRKFNPSIQRPELKKHLEAIETGNPAEWHKLFKKLG